MKKIGEYKEKEKLLSNKKIIKILRLISFLCNILFAEEIYNIVYVFVSFI